jgi:hypothetical protein
MASYSEQGVDFPFKRAFFDTWLQLQSAEGEIAPPDNGPEFLSVVRYAEVWSENFLTPASYKKFNVMERECISLGVFHQVAGRRPYNPQAQQPNRTSRSGPGKRDFFSTRVSQPNRPHVSSHRQEEDGDDGPVLWAAEAVSSGSIDDKGVFHAEKALPPGFLPPQGMSPNYVFSADTQWYYKDPKGNEQGPFSASAMLEWYSGGYFPEILPMRRQQDRDFEPLSIWKTRNNGSIPFTISASVPVAPKSTSFPSTAPSEVSFGSLGAMDTQKARDTVIMEKVEEPKKPSVIGEEKRVKKIDVSSLFSTPSTVAAFTSPSVQTIQSTLEPEKRAVTPPNRSSVPTAKPAPASITAVPTEANRASTGDWSTVSNVGSSWSTSTQQQLRSTPTTVSTPSVQTEGAGWKSTQSLQTESLNAIRAQQQQEETKKPVVPQKKPAEPMTFAELVKSMNSATIAQPTVVVPATLSPSAASKKSTTTTTSTPSVQGAKSATVQLREWCIAQLAPLQTSSLDVTTVVSLLMELKSASEAAAFIRDNFDASLVDLATFGREFCNRKYNKDMPSYVFVPQTPQDDEQPFEQVRKRR